jgi:4-amino-4-deoxy-L-arabinose transferase-like glycosyltransferase
MTGPAAPPAARSFELARTVSGLADTRLWRFAILVLALALRVYDLGGESVWIDEGFSIRVAQLPLPELFQATRYDIHPPLYYVLLHFWIGWFGHSEAAVRAPSVVWGVLGVWALERLGRRLFGPSTGLIAALLLAVSPFHVHYSQEARAYAQNLFFSLLSLTAFLSWMRSGGRRRAVSYVLATALMVYTHSYGWLAVGAQNLAALLPWFRPLRPHGPRAREWLAWQGVLLVLFLPWLVALAGQVETVRVSFYAGAPTWLTLGGTAIGFAGSPALLALSGAALARWLLSGLGRPVDPDAARRRAAAGFLALWVAMLLLVPFVTSNLLFPSFIRRATMGALPAWLLLVAAAIAAAGGGWLRRAVVVVMVALCGLELWSYYREVNKERWRELAATIEREARSGDLILFNAWYPKRDAYDYYSRRTDIPKLPFPELGQPWGTDPAARLERLVEDRPRVWVVLSHSSDADGIIVRTLGRTRRLAWHQVYVNMSLDRSRQRDYPGIEAYRFDRR